MGEIADLIIEGEICQLCGTTLSDPQGYPTTCSSCLREAKREATPGQPRHKVSCPVCGKRVTSVGLADHKRVVHGILTIYHTKD